MRNPAVEWDRFAKAVFDKSLHQSSIGGMRIAGGSTLATQIEKYRHSPDGRTGSCHGQAAPDGLGHVRAYLDGEDTTQYARRQIVVDYLNTVPLSARPAIGEVNGLGDGLWAWYGRTSANVNRILKQPARTAEERLETGRSLQAGAEPADRPAPPDALPDRGRELLNDLDRQPSAPAGRRASITPRCATRHSSIKLRFRNDTAAAAVADFVRGTQGRQRDAHPAAQAC